MQEKLHTHTHTNMQHYEIIQISRYICCLDVVITMLPNCLYSLTYTCIYFNLDKRDVKVVLILPSKKNLNQVISAAFIFCRE